MTEQLTIHAVGMDLPEPQQVRDLATAAGGDVQAYSGWPGIRVAADDDHPATLAARALSDALEQTGISASDLKIVVSTGMSREYLGSWSLATEVMRQHAAPSTCMPLDINCGCLATLWSLSLMQGWLGAQGGGYAAIVCGERLSGTVDRSDNAAQHLWAYGDGGAALIVGVGTGAPALWKVESMGFASHAEFSGILRVEYGGTRHPLPPEGATNFRKFAPVPLSKVREAYVNGYRDAFAAARKHTKVIADRVVCNQVSPNFLPVVAETAGLPLERVVTTGNVSGHVGSVDLAMGLRQVLDDGGPVPLAVAASTPFAFGAGYLEPAS